jgi:hypothetical protein
VSAPTLGLDWQGRLRALEQGWDSYSAPPISHAAIDTLEHFATVPMNDGGIQLEVHRDGFDIEIAIAPSGKIATGLISFEAKPCELVAKWMLANGFATGHGDTIQDLLAELKGEIAEREKKAVACALANQREFDRSCD